MIMPHWLRMREAAAAASAGALERGVGDVDNDGDTDTPASSSGDGDGDDAQCPTCSGSGIVNGTICGTCNGSGSKMSEADKPAEVTCPTCKGKGTILGGNVKCKTCNGSGKVPADSPSLDKKPAGPPWAKGKESETTEERIAALELALAQTQSLRESKPAVLNATFSTPTRVKAKDGREGYQVVLIREGRGNADDDNWYTGASIRELCESGVAEGMQAYANHPDLQEEVDRPERDVKQLVGSYSDVTFSESGGSPRANAVFVPLTTDEKHPTYGWVVTLAEAATSNTGPQPLCGISLYGLSAGDYGPRPDGTEGRVVTMIRPTSGDVVTNAGAGGEFVRRVMMESARRLRRSETQRKDEPMQIGDFRTQMAEALKLVSEADSDEKRTEALAKVKIMEAEAAKVDAPPATVVPGTIEAMTEAAPALVAKIREADKAESEDLRAQLAEKVAKLSEAEKFISGITDVQAIAGALREADVTDAKELRHFAQNARILGLSEKADIRDMVETERAYSKSKEDALLEKLRESMDLLPEVEGFGGRIPNESVTTDGGMAALAASGIPTKSPASA